MLMGVRNFLRGSLQVDLRGAAVERFLNLCSIHGVAFWDMRCLDVDHFTAWVSVGGYLSLRPYARKTGCKVHVIQKRGLPFASRFLVKRWVLFLCFILSIVAVYYLSAFVWTIEVQGCEQTTETEILGLVKKAGLRTGTKRSDCDLVKMRNIVMSSTDKLSYFTINFKGIHAIIEVQERENPAEKPKEQPPCDVVSDLTGIVLRLRVRTGKAMVQIGDTIQPGDLLASGTIRNENDETQITQLHAEAEADVRTWYTLRAAVPCELQLLNKTEAYSESRTFLLGERRFPLGLIEKKAVPWYDKQIKTHYLYLHQYFRWPIGLERQKIICCEAEKAAIDAAALSNLLEQRMLHQLLTAKPEAQLVQADFTLEQSSQGAWLGVLKVELVETTGLEVPIG